MFLFAGTATLTAADAPDSYSPAPHLLREIWVPADDLGTVLSRYPRAVSLDRDQLFTLLRDAHAADPNTPDPKNVPSAGAVLRSARLDGHLVTAPDARLAVQVHAELEIEALSEHWEDVPLGLPGISLGAVEVPTGQPNTALLPAGSPDSPVGLRVQGRGVHQVRLEFLLPVTSGPAGSSILLPDIDGVGEFTLHLPAGTRAGSDRGCAVQADSAGILARVALRHANVPLPASVPNRLNWRAVPPATAGQQGAVLQEGSVTVTVAESGLAITQGVRLRPALGRLTGEARLALPAGARAVRVEQAAGATLRWDIGADGLHVLLPAAEEENPDNAAFTVSYLLPLPLDPHGAMTRAGIPLLEVAGAHRVTGELGVWSEHGTVVRRIEPGAMASPLPGGTYPDAVADFTLVDLPPAGDNAAAAAAPPVVLTLEARRTATRFSVDADACADLQPDGVHLERTLNFQVEEGELFTARVRLPVGETLLGVQPAAGCAQPQWRQEGADLLLTWNTGLREASKTTIKLASRADLAAPRTGAPTAFTLAAVLVSGAERLTGYVALTSAPGFRIVAAGGEERLEQRGGRATPVRGGTAWFYRDDFRLVLRVERLAAETEARFTGYALPLAGAVEVHAQLAYHFLYSGVEEVKIRVPPSAADAFFFTGERVAERRRDGDVWTVRFQGEQTGDYTPAGWRHQAGRVDGRGCFLPPHPWWKWS